MPETTENYHRIPVSSGHDSHDIKTIEISSGEGIKALYCVDCKEIVTYLFDVDKWTMEEAQGWVEDHKSCGGDYMSKKLDRRTKDGIGSRVRYKSYGTFIPKGSGEGADEIFVRGFFTSDEVDEVGDVITREATVAAVDKWRQWGNIRTMHDSPSGRVDKIGEADGLEWNELVTVPVDANTKALIEGGVLKAYSVGIIPRKYEINQEALEEAGEDIDPWFLPLIINEYDMVEISYVDHPANYAATISEIGSEKFKDMSQRAILFKSSDIMGDIENMDKDKDSVEEQELEDAEEVNDDDVQPEGEDLDSGEEEVVEAELEADVEKDDVSEEEEVVEKDEVEEFDVALAVGDIKGSLEGLEERVSSLTESIDGFVDRVVERFMDALSAQEESADDDGEEDEDNDDTSDAKLFDEEEFVERVVSKVLQGITEILAPEAIRSAKMTVDDDGEPDASETSEEKTKRYMEMTPGERRVKLAEMIDKIRTK